MLLNTFTPDLHVRYFRDLRQMIADGQPLTAENAERAMGRYATRDGRRLHLTPQRMLS